MALIAPSILAADFADLAGEVASVHDAVDWVHVDLMDGHFVPNLTIGPPVVRSLRAHTDLFFDCHLMVSDPATWLGALAEAGAQLCTGHVETGDLRPFLRRAHDLGMQAGVVIDGPTPFEAVEPYLDEGIDLLLVMTIKAGFGGQRFQPEQLEKVERAAKLRSDRGLSFLIEVDGGIDPRTAAPAAGAGAEVFVAGTAIFGRPDRVAAVGEIRSAVGG